MNCVLHILTIIFWTAISGVIGFEGMRYSSEYLFDSTPTLLTNWDKKITESDKHFDTLISNRNNQASEYFNKVKYKGSVGTYWW